MCNIVNKIKEAKKSILLVDDFVDEETLNLLNEKDMDVKVEIISRNRPLTNQRNVRRRQNFKAGFKFIESNNFRNRYVYIDDKVLYLLSRSLKFNAKRSFYYISVLDKDQVEDFKRNVAGCETQSKNRYRHF